MRFFVFLNRSQFLFTLLVALCFHCLCSCTIFLVLLLIQGDRLSSQFFTLLQYLAVSRCISLLLPTVLCYLFIDLYCIQLFLLHTRCDSCSILNWPTHMYLPYCLRWIYVTLWHKIFQKWYCLDLYFWQTVLQYTTPSPLQFCYVRMKNWTSSSVTNIEFHPIENKNFTKICDFIW